MDDRKQFRIREATQEDLEGIVELWKLLTYDQLSKDTYYSGSYSFPGGEKQFTNALASESCCIHVAEQDGQLIGFTEVWLKEPDFHFFADEYAYILHFFVDERYRSFKAARRLYNASEKWAIEKGRQFLVADVFGHNEKVRLLLEKRAGLEVYRRRMVKDLRTT